MASLLAVPLAVALPLPPTFAHDDAGSGADAPGEPDPSFAVATGTVHNGTISSIAGDNRDVYAFAATAGQSVHVRATGHLGCAYLYGPALEELGRNCPLAENVYYSVWAIAVEPGVHFVAFSGWSVFVNGVAPPSEHKPYRFSIGLDGYAPDTEPEGFEDPRRGDAGTDHDAPDAPARLIWLEDQDQMEGSLSNAFSDGQDWYAFHGLAGQTVTVRFFGTSPLCADVRDDRDTEAWCEGPGINPLSPSLLVSYTSERILDRDGTWFVRVTGFQGGDYAFSIGIDAAAPPTFVPQTPVDPNAPDDLDWLPSVPIPHVPVPLVQDDAGSGGDAPENASLPAPFVLPGTTYSGTHTGVTDDYLDRYAFHATKGQSIHLRATGMEGCVGVEGPDGNEIGSECWIIQNGVYSVWARAPDNGSYHIIMHSAGPAKYRFAFELDDFAPDPAPGPASVDGAPHDNDADSGHDAPDIRVPLITLDTGVYDGIASLLVTWDTDHFHLDATEGQTVEIRLLHGSGGCAAIVHVDADPPYGCSILLGELASQQVRTLDRPGEWYVRVSHTGGPYTLALGIDEAAPPLPGGL